MREPFPEDQFYLRQAVMSRLPEHLGCVLPDDSGQLTVSVAKLEGAVELLLKYEDCFVGASGNVGWTDIATHSIDTGINRPVKQPPRMTCFVEKDQIERQLSQLLLDDKIQASESPWASPVLHIKKKMVAGVFALTIAV